jgi:hypothetical protein
MFTAVLFHGVFSDVISAAIFFTLPVVAFCGVAGLALAVPTIRRIHRNDPYFGNAITRPLTYLLAPFLIAGVVWLFLAKSIPWAAAVAFGSPHAESHEFTLSTYTRKGCNSVAKPVKRLNMFGSLCVNEDYVRRYAGRIVLIRLVGDRTFLGFRITRIEHEAALGLAPPDRHAR